MTEAEFIVLDYMKGTPGARFTRKEIARRAVKRTEFEENPHWADAPLAALVSRGVIQIDEQGLYCLSQRY
jgi:hypothetical protein